MSPHPSRRQGERSVLTAAKSNVLEGNKYLQLNGIRHPSSPGLLYVPTYIMVTLPCVLDLSVGAEPTLCPHGRMIPLVPM